LGAASAELRALKAEKLKAIEPKIEVMPVTSAVIDSTRSDLPLMIELDFAS